jgi:hypothetical protein
MKLLTATAHTQGSRPGDFDFCVEGELVLIGPICASDRSNPADGRCGCGRSFAGLNSHRASTTAAVRDIDISLADYTEPLRSSIDQQGYCDCNAADVARDLATIADQLAAGTVIGRAGSNIFVRHRPDVASGDRHEPAAPA